MDCCLDDLPILNQDNESLNCLLIKQVAFSRVTVAFQFSISDVSCSYLPDLHCHQHANFWHSQAYSSCEPPGVRRVHLSLQSHSPEPYRSQHGDDRGGHLLSHREVIGHSVPAVGVMMLYRGQTRPSPHMLSPQRPGLMGVCLRCRA